MDIPKPKLTVDEQINHLKAKGVQFNIMDEDAAREYLTYNTNYFRVAAYRKNYRQHPDGQKKGQYVNLEFAYLVEIASIDNELRHVILRLSAEIEHYIRMTILSLIEKTDDDGYAMLQAYIQSLDEKSASILQSEIKRNQSSPYCQEMERKYREQMPVWVFVELISLGRLISLYEFCGQYFDEPTMSENFYRLLSCKTLRNAAAHNSCILNDLRKIAKIKFPVNNAVMQAVSNMPNISSGFARKRLHNLRLAQITTMMFVHQQMVVDEDMKQGSAKALHQLIDFMNRKEEFFDSNNLIAVSWKYLDILIDTWY
ncbi:MAG: Abi family protein [Peptococcaceae bacterium]|nr:Abi family protein [Peptococcaceae bacterium]